MFSDYNPVNYTMALFLITYGPVIYSTKYLPWRGDLTNWESILVAAFVTTWGLVALYYAIKVSRKKEESRKHNPDASPPPANGEE